MSALPSNVTVAMLTTITVNGPEGLRFLASLQELSQRDDHPRVPPALAAMIEHVTGASSQEDLEHVRLEVAAPLADEIAAFVDELGSPDSWPLLFSAQLNDLVVLVRDVLAEVHVTKREGRTWQYLAAGTVGRLVARKGDLGKLLLLDGPYARDHIYISDRCTTRARSRVVL
jgi:hypothetical protein